MFGLALEGEHVTFCLRKQQPLWQLPAGDGGGGQGGSSGSGGGGRETGKERTCLKQGLLQAKEIDSVRQQVGGNGGIREVRHSNIQQQSRHAVLAFWEGGMVVLLYRNLPISGARNMMH